MYSKIIKNDIKKSKLITMTSITFVTAAATLVSLAMIMAATLFGSIDTMMEQAKTTHFLQMHTGSLDMQQLEAFAYEHENVEDFQVLNFLNIDGAKMLFGENSLASSMEDNGISTQSKRFDFLLDLDGSVIQVNDGEIYVPLAYMKDGTAMLGDEAVICGKTFIVTGFLRDSQMNSTLSSSKRFLVSENDYAELEKMGNLEYLIEFRLIDSSKVGEFETAYVDAKLPANGPAITHPLFRLMNAITDGIMIAVIILISIIVILIALLCIRVTLIAKIEDDTREIGTMKAIGMRISDIRKIYLTKYAFISCLGCMIGYLLSFAFKGILLENIRLFMGEGAGAYLGQIFALMGVTVVFFAILLYVNAILHTFKKISSAEAIRFGAAEEKYKESKRFHLANNTFFSTNVFLGIKDVLSRKKLYITMLMVLVMSAFIIIVPQKLYSTVSSKEFIGYVGVGNCDIRMDIQQTENITEKASDVATMMENDENIGKYVLLTTQTFTAIKDDGTVSHIRVELGDHSVFPVTYIDGHLPTETSEIALSVMNADEFGKSVGDSLLLTINGQETALTVCGIYSDVTNGGKTAKATFTDDSAETMWCILNVDIAHNATIDSVVQKYAEHFGFAKVAKVESYMEQMFGSTINSIKTAAYAGIIISMIVTLLITLLFLKMLIAKDKHNIASLKALGFRNSDIKKQYSNRFILILILSLILGIIFANTLGELLAGLLISQLGVTSFRFAASEWQAALLCPILMCSTVLIAIFLGTKDIGNVSIADNIKE